MIHLSVATLDKRPPLPACRALIQVICGALNEALSGLGLVYQPLPYERFSIGGISPGDSNDFEPFELEFWNAAYIDAVNNQHTYFHNKKLSDEIHASYAASVQWLFLRTSLSW